MIAVYFFFAFQQNIRKVCEMILNLSEKKEEKKKTMAGIVLSKNISPLMVQYNY